MTNLDIHGRLFAKLAKIMVFPVPTALAWPLPQ